MKKSLLSILLSAALSIGLCLTSSAQIQRGFDIDGDIAYDNSGSGISMPDANTIAIGAVHNDAGGNNAGQVKIYTSSGSGWIQKGASIYGEAAGDISGASVSMPDSNTVAIGAPDNDGNGNIAGQVRIYKWNGTAWVQKGTDIDGKAAGDRSGWTVSMPDSNTVAIGSPQSSGNGTGNGAGQVRIFNWNGSAWVQKGADINGSVAYYSLGNSVSMPDANTVAIGAYAGSNLGCRVLIYTWSGSAWVQKGLTLDRTAVLNDSFGFNVSMPDSNTVASGGKAGNGYARIYTWNTAGGGSWTQKGLDINGEAAGDEAQVVSMPDTNTIAIGAPYNDGNGTNAGHVRIYRWNNGAWMKVGLDIDGEAAGDNSGLPVSMPDANTVAIGAVYNGGNGTEAGHVRVYSLCATAFSISDTVCGSYVSPSGNHTWTTSGIYTDIIPNSIGCDSVITVHLVVKTLPIVTLAGNADTVCLNSGTYTLTGGIPIGGNYSGIGVAGSILNPTAIGNVIITYSYTDVNGCSNSATEAIIIDSCLTQNCHATYSLVPDTVTPHNWWTNNQATGSGSLSYTWYWGDGTNSTGFAPSHTYSTPGNYNICLDISDGAGCTDTYCDSSTYIFKAESMITINGQLQTALINVVDELIISIRPNPATNQLFIESGGNIVNEINIFNTTGLLVSQTKQPANNRIDISTLANGVYIAEVKVREAVQRLRWVKM